MSTSALLFMAGSWAFALGLMSWAFARVLRARRDRDSPPDAL